MATPPPQPLRSGSRVASCCAFGRERSATRSRAHSTPARKNNARHLASTEKFEHPRSQLERTAKSDRSTSCARRGGQTACGPYITRFGRVPASAPQHTPRVAARLVGVGTVGAAGPLPHIPGEIPRRLAMRAKAPHRCGCRRTVVARVHGGPGAFPDRFAHVREHGGSSPQGNVRASVPRAASSHSSSVGSRLPSEAQYVLACSQSTQLIGWSSLVPAPLQNLLSKSLPFGVSPGNSTVIGASQASHSA